MLALLPPFQRKPSKSKNKEALFEIKRWRASRRVIVKLDKKKKIAIVHVN